MGTWKSVIATFPSWLKRALHSHFAKLCLNSSNWTLLAFLKKTRLFSTFFGQTVSSRLQRRGLKGKNWKKLNLGCSRAVRAKIKLCAKQWAPQDFFSIFLFRTNKNKSCSSAKKVFFKKVHFWPFYGQFAVWAVTASIFSGHQKQMLRKWK